MIESTLHFFSIIDLVDFQAAVKVAVNHYNLTDLTLTADFSEADIELAKAAFGAVVVMDMADK